MIGNQIKELRKYENLSQQDFATSLGLSRIYIATIEAGKNVPSERTVNDICNLYKINKEWLTTGLGEMHRSITKSEEITIFMADLLNQEDDSFKKRFISMLSELPDDKWEWLEQMATNLVNK